MLCNNAHKDYKTKWLKKNYKEKLNEIYLCFSSLNLSQNEL